MVRERDAGARRGGSGKERETTILVLGSGLDELEELGAMFGGRRGRLAWLKKFNSGGRRAVGGAGRRRSTRSGRFAIGWCWARGWTRLGRTRGLVVDKELVCSHHGGGILVSSPTELIAEVGLEAVIFVGGVANEESSHGAFFGLWLRSVDHRGLGRRRRRRFDASARKRR